MNKAAIIIDPELPVGLLANAVACITSGLFVNEPEMVGPQIEGDDISYIPITKIPILILKPGASSLHEIFIKAKNSGIKYMAFTKEAQSTTDYLDYQKNVIAKPAEQVTLVGLGVVGHFKQVNSLVGSLPMLR